MTDDETEPKAERRLRLLRRMLRAIIVLAAVAVLCMAWAVAIEPRFILTEQEETAEIPGLPSEWHGASVGVIADLQVGMWWDNVGMARRAVGALVEHDPSMVLVLGDLVYEEDNVDHDVDTVIDVLRPLEQAGIPTFAVLGNHDHSAGAAGLLRERLPEIGIELLENEAVPIERNRQPIYVVGIGAERPGEARPREALDDIAAEAPRIVMMHNPDTFDRIPAGEAPFAVAGHTHGGQIRIPFFPNWSAARMFGDDAIYADGWIDGYGAVGNRLFVNRGIGMSFVPARFSASPAITLFELEPAGDP